MSLNDGWNMGESLRHRLLWSVLLPMAILLVINVAVVSKFGYDSATRRHDHYLLNTGNVLKDQLHIRQGKLQFDNAGLNILNEDKNDQVYYSLAGVMQEYRFGTPDLPAPPDEVSEVPVYYFDIYQGRPVRMMAAIMQEADIPGGRVVVTVAKTLVLHHERAWEWIWRVLPANFLLMGLSALLVWWGVGRGLRPLLLLRDEVTSRSSQDLRPLPEAEIISEVRPLIHSFNELMEQLDLALGSKRRFISNAAHQLRTPLSGFRTQAELIMRMNDVKEIHRTMQQMHIAADQAGRMINQLLVLASSESDAQLGSSYSQLDLAALTREIATNWVTEALRKSIDMGFECGEEYFHLMGNSLLLGEMLGNLIDNALRYTQLGGKVTVRIIRAANGIHLEVEDNGPGIPVAERERIFERFYRVSGSGQQGSGLGLSIVREIAHRHHAEIFVLSGADGCGTLMRVVFGADKLT